MELVPIIQKVLIGLVSFFVLVLAASFISIKFFKPQRRSDVGPYAGRVPNPGSFYYKDGY